MHQSLGAGPDRQELGRAPSAKTYTVLLALVTVFHLATQCFQPSGIAADISQILLMPLLAGVIYTLTASPRSRLVRLVLIALFFSWVGDTLPRFIDGDPGFLAMVSGFLVAQFFYISSLAPYWRSSIVSRPWKVIPYVSAFVLLLIFCAPGAGALLIPVVIYGLALMAMAVLSTGLGWLAGFGGAVFFVSDSLIALRSFADFEIPIMGFWIMLTYVAGQAMISYAATKK